MYSMLEKQDAQPGIQRRTMRPRFEKSVILEVVRRRESGESSKVLCLEFGVANTTLFDWMERYGSTRYHAQKIRMVERHEIRTVVRAVREGRMSRQDAAAKCGVSVGTVKGWMRNPKYNDEGPAVPSPGSATEVDSSTLSQE